MWIISWFLSFSASSSLPLHNFSFFLTQFQSLVAKSQGANCQSILSSAFPKFTFGIDSLLLCRKAKILVRKKQPCKLHFKEDDNVFMLPLEWLSSGDMSVTLTRLSSLQLYPCLSLMHSLFRTANHLGGSQAKKSKKVPCLFLVWLPSRFQPIGHACVYSRIKEKFDFMHQN
jgi:hypothetical protein